MSTALNDILGKQPTSKLAKLAQSATTQPTSPQPIVPAKPSAGTEGGAVYEAAKPKSVPTILGQQKPPVDGPVPSGKQTYKPGEAEKMLNPGGVPVGASMGEAEKIVGRPLVKPRDMDVTRSNVFDPNRKYTYTEMYQALTPYKPPTQEELEKERKKAKREKVFAAIGDGISALSNLYFTSKGAPNMYNHNDSQSKQVAGKWDKLREDREAQMNAYVAGLMRARQADEAHADNERTWARQIGLDMAKANIANEELRLKQNKDERDAKLSELESELKRGKITEQEFKAKKAETEAKYADAVQQSIVDRNKASAVASRASANNSNASATEHRARAKGEFEVYDKDGKPHYFKDEDAAKLFARQHGTYFTTSSETVVDVSDGTKSKKTSTTKPSGWYSPKPQPKPKPKPASKSQPKPATGKKISTGVKWG